MEASGGIGLGIGVGFIVGFVVALIFVGGTNQGTSIVEDIPVIENIPDLVYNEPKLGYVTANYNDDNDKLSLAVVLTDKNAEYTTADGTLNIQVLKDERQVYSTTKQFVKDDFYSWKNALTGEKVMGYRLDLNQYFASGSHDVYITMTLPDGSYWENMHASFYSLN